jgi:hypothetical protein
VSFGFLPGLLALGALAPLLLAYFLRRKQKPRVVSALFLWRSPSLLAEKGPRFERFSREASLLIEVTAVVAAALFLANVRCNKDASRRHAVIVLDGSLSMRAKIGSEELVDRVRREVARVVSEEGAEVLTVVESGGHPKVLVGPRAEAARVEEALASWRPSQPAHDFGSALMMARELAVSKGERILFLTDGPPQGDPAWPEEVEVRSVGEPADNLAFVSAQRRDEGGVAHVGLRVASFSKKKQTVSLVFSGGDQSERRSLELDPGATMDVRIELKTTEPIVAALPPDALLADSEVTLPPSPLREIAVGIDPALDPAAKAALERFFAVAAGVRLSSEPTLTWGPPGARASVTLGADGKRRSFVGPFFAEKSDALLDDVRFSGVVWTAGDNPPGHPVASMGNTSLVSLEDDGRLHFNVDLSRSNLQRTAAWPVLLSNVVRDARLKVPGFARKILMLGEEADIVTEPGAHYELESPLGTKTALFGKAATRLPVEDAGTWRMTKDGRLLDTLSVLALDSRESDLSTRGAYEVRARAPAGYGAAATEPPRPRWLLGLFAALVLIDFWITASTTSGRGRLLVEQGAPK